MNKKIILLVAVLLIVALVFVACKGKGDGDETTTEPTVETTESTSPSIEIEDAGDALDSGILPGVIVDGDMSGDGVINIGDQEEENSEDSIGWDEIIGK